MVPPSCRHDVPPAMSERVVAALQRGHTAGRRGRKGRRGRGTAPELEAPVPRAPRTVAETRVDAATAGMRYMFLVHGCFRRS